MRAGQLEKTSLGVIPNPLKLLRALMRPGKPFVMINMLCYKQQATGDFSHLSGKEAYGQYAQSVQKAQAPLGSSLLWSGEVKQKLTVGNGPDFHAIGLLQYASPKAFLKFLTKGGSDTKARGAGLLGQWLIAATTVEEYKMPDSREGHLVLVELSGDIKQGHPQAMMSRKSAYEVFGGQTLWLGRCDHHILGDASPGIEEVLVTWFPDEHTFQNVLRDPKRNDYLKSSSPYAAYTATSDFDFLPELRP